MRQARVNQTKQAGASPESIYRLQKMHKRNSALIIRSLGDTQCAMAQPSSLAHVFSENLRIIVSLAPTRLPTMPAMSHLQLSILGKASAQSRECFTVGEEETSLFGRSPPCRTFHPDVSTAAERIKVCLCLRGVEEANVSAI